MAALLTHEPDRLTFAFLHLAGPTGEALGKYEAAAGHSLIGYKHLLTSDFIRHTRNRRHGDSLAISDEDFLKLPALLGAPDCVGRAKDQRKQVMSVEVVSSQGHKYSVIQEIRKGHRKLAVVTLIKHQVSDALRPPL